MERAQFCQIAPGSASEREYQLLPAKDLSYLDEASHQLLDSQAVEAKRTLTSPVARLREA